MIDLARHRVERILLVKPSSLGDVVHALPVLNGLRGRYPAARIGWLVSTVCQDLLAGHPQLDEVIPFDRRRYGRMLRSPSAARAFWGFLRALRGRRFDLVVDLQGLLRSGFMSLASGAKLRMGFSGARELAWMFYTHRLPPSPPDAHAVDRYYQVAGPLGFAGVPIRFVLPVDPAARAAAAGMLAEGGIADGRPYAVLAPGTRWETKRWPAEFFSELGRQIRDRHGLAVVLAGSTDEAEAAGQVAGRLGPGAVNLAGRTSLAQLVALLAGARLAVMNDTGPMHVAAALEVPLVAIFGPTNPARTGPYRRPASVCRLDLPCSPCYLKRLADCPHGHRCLRGLLPAQVGGRVAAVLAHSEGPS